jgi:hypothetical protein
MIRFLFWLACYHAGHRWLVLRGHRGEVAPPWFENAYDQKAMAYNRLHPRWRRAR